VTEKLLMKGNHAIAEAAIRAGCQCYFGYPITPQSEIGEYLSLKMPEAGKVFLPAESELAAINMVLGSGSTGVKAMTSSSSPGIALMQEAISFMAGAEIPGVIANVSRAGPGLGDVTPSQGDYIQTVKGGGNGDYRVIVLAPSTVQEMADYTYRAFYLSQKYRTPTFILADGILGQMMEPVIFNEYVYPDINTSEWALNGAEGRNARSLHSYCAKDGVCFNDSAHQRKIRGLFAKYDLIAKNETSYESLYLDDAQIVITAFGSVARIAKKAVIKAREAGIKVGLIRPITLFPFPEEILSEVAGSADIILDIEMNMGQMLQDVKLAVNGKTSVEFYGKQGGVIPTVEDIYETVKNLIGSKTKVIK
jgi:2-oxoglutarate ferredoxin oxidoreductase subunit alpha